MASTQYDPLDPYGLQDPNATNDGYTNADAKASLLDGMNSDPSSGRVGITDPGQGSNKATADTTPAPTSSANAGAPTYDQVNAGYQQYLGRPASQDEYNNWVNGTYGATDLQGILGQIQGSGEAQAYSAAHGGGTSVSPTAPAPTDLRGRINAALQAAGSTDDPNYWYKVISADPNGGGSAWNYWVDRINRGDGSSLGLPKFIDAGNNTPTSSNNYRPTGAGTPYQTSAAAAPAASTTPYQNPMLPYVQGLLKTLLERDQTPIDTSSPEVNPALTAYKGQQANALADTRNSLAERAYAQGTGTNSGDFNAGLAGAQEKAGQATAGFAGNLIYNANQARQGQLQNLLQVATSLGLTDQAQQLQDEINRLNLGYNYTALNANLNQSALLAGLG